MFQRVDLYLVIILLPATPSSRDATVYDLSKITRIEGMPVATAGQLAVTIDLS